MVRVVHVHDVAAVEFVQVLDLPEDVLYEVVQSLYEDAFVRHDRPDQYRHLAVFVRDRRLQLQLDVRLAGPPEDAEIAVLNVSGSGVVCQRQPGSVELARLQKLRS